MKSTFPPGLSLSLTTQSWGGGQGGEQRNKGNSFLHVFRMFYPLKERQKEGGHYKAQKLRRGCRFRYASNLSCKPTFCVLQHKKHRLLRNRCTCAGTPCWARGDGWSFCSCFVFTAFLRPWQRTRSVVPSVAFGACCALCLSTKANLSELLWASEKPLICCSMPLGPWRLCWWHLAWVQSTEDATKLPLKSITMGQCFY